MTRRPPASVWIAVTALCVVTAFQIVLALVFARPGQIGWGMYAFAGLLWALLVSGLLRGSRLAWLWGRYLGLVLGGVLTGALLFAAFRRELGVAVASAALLGMAAPLFVTVLALGRRSAYAFFDLVCPVCAARTGLAADMMFRRARCRSCQNVW